MDTYPIIIDGETVGELQMERQGGRCRFFARCRMLPGLVRLSVYGGGREAYLGLLAPENGELTLRRTLTRLDMAGFPERILRVGRAGEPEEAASESQPEPAAEADPRPEAESEAEPEPDPPCAAAIEAEEEATPEEAQPEPRAEAEPEPDRAWYSSPDGALLRYEGDVGLLALPLGDDRIPEDRPGEALEIEGKQYLVFRVREGNFI